MTRAEIRKMILRELLSEQSNTKSQDDVSSPGLDFGSVDQQIDAFILKFEKDSITNHQDDLLPEAAVNTMSLIDILNEQDDDEADNQDSEQETTPPESDEDLKDTAPAANVPKPPLNIDEFTRRVARLGMNYQNLIDVQGTIVERALRFLKDNYDLEHANQMIDLLNQQFDFEIGEQDSQGDGPYAAGAYDGGTGGGGAA